MASFSVFQAEYHDDSKAEWGKYPPNIPQTHLNVSSVKGGWNVTLYHPPNALLTAIRDACNEGLGETMEPQCAVQGCTEPSHPCYPDWVAHDKAVNLCQAHWDAYIAYVMRPQKAITGADVVAYLAELRGDDLRKDLEPVTEAITDRRVVDADLLLEYATRVFDQYNAVIEYVKLHLLREASGDAQ
jgi:hypothetical protein